MTMTSHERFKRMFEHREADRVPIVDHPWGDTIERWHAEGMPEDMHFSEYFGIDNTGMIQPDTSPRYPAKEVERTEEYVISTTAWGATLRKWTHASSTPEFLDFTIKDPDSWAKAKKRMTPSADRVDWKTLDAEYRRWREEGWWVQCAMWFGFDVTHSWTIGTERMLIAMAEDPEWCLDMFNHELDMSIAMMEMVLDKGYEIDSSYCWDDMGFKNNQFFSLKMFRELLKPVHKRAIEWAHSKGMKSELHSCGDVRPFIPEFIEIGLDALNPLEVKAGMDTLEIKRKYGKDLVLHGGINAAIWDDLPKFEAEMRAKVPVLKQGGGYIFGTDHSVPNCVSLEAFRDVVELAKKLGAYE